MRFTFWSLVRAGEAYELRPLIDIYSDAVVVRAGSKTTWYNITTNPNDGGQHEP